MVRSALLPPSERLAKARERFLVADPVRPGDVREPILASWWRSRQWKVAADRVTLSYIRDPDMDTPLTRSALPVLKSLHENLDGQPISVILTDAAGVVLSRLTADNDLERHLDGVQLAPGFSYAEEQVGTNGIGTALEGGQPAHVFGHEHYAEDLEDLACAGVPIHDPISGKTVGAVDLTCWRKHADSLLVALAKTAADQITNALLADTSMRESQLLRDYLRTCRHTSGIVLALSSDMVMMNDSARQMLTAGDQAAVLGHAADVMASGRAGAVTLALPSGASARMFCRPVLSGADFDGAEPVGGVVHIKLVEQPAPVVAEPSPQRPMFLPGLVGCAPLWLRGCTQVESVYTSGEWLLLEGEPGIGKLAVVRAVHQRHNPSGRFHVLDSQTSERAKWLADLRRELLEGEGTLVIRYLDKLGAREMNALSNALQEARTAGRQEQLWVAATVSRDRPNADVGRVLRFLPSTVDLPPLRHHIEDLHDLVPFFLAKLGQQARLTCSPEAMQLLLRSRWPGNIEQLWQVLKQVARHRRSGTIQPADLPPECWTVSRRLLSPLESMERDAIVQGLIAYQGNKVRTAESLGMSRATIYRKIREYGIVVPVS
jgi:sigma-54 dependent transcriptional regulator, acetoin dehydrogenase operon transcriptional activator AcoR